MVKFKRTSSFCLSAALFIAVLPASAEKSMQIPSPILVDLLLLGSERFTAWDLLHKKERQEETCKKLRHVLGDSCFSCELSLADSHHQIRHGVIATVILGTGTNAVYVEKEDQIKKMNGQMTNSGEMVINMEWGGFNTSKLPLTEYDKALDSKSLNPGEQGMLSDATSFLYAEFREVDL